MFGTQHLRSPWDCQAWPCSVATGAGPASSHWIWSFYPPAWWPGCVPLSQQHFPAKTQHGVRKEVGTTARNIGHVPAASAGTAWRRQWEMVKALIVAHGFVVFHFLPRKKTHKTKNQQKTPRKVESSACSSLCPGAQGCLHQAAPLLQTKTHHKTQEFKSLRTESLNFPNPGAADLPVPGDQPTPLCFTIAEKPQKRNP